MISPNTPPGTEVVCVDDVLRANWAPPGKRVIGDLDGLTSGVVYTVRDIVADDYDPEPCVRLVEIVRDLAGKDPREVGYRLCRFRYLSRFASESSYTTTAPVDDGERERRREPSKESA